jgi:hypothetical protein
LIPEFPAGPESSAAFHENVRLIWFVVPASGGDRWSGTVGRVVSMRRR